jgi:sulfite reductase beta subunit-like hemoprotein
VQGQEYKLDNPPFSVNLTGQAGSTVEADVVLHLNEGADEDKREVKLQYNVRLMSSAVFEEEVERKWPKKLQRALQIQTDELSWRQDFQFLTQEGVPSVEGIRRG